MEWIKLVHHERGQQLEGSVPDTSWSKGIRSAHALLTLFAFGVLASPASAILLFVLQDFVLPSFSTFFRMTLLGVFALFAEVLLARGFQLEKTCNVANIKFIELSYKMIVLLVSASLSSDLLVVIIQVLMLLLILDKVASWLYWLEPRVGIVLLQVDYILITVAAVESYIFLTSHDIMKNLISKRKRKMGKKGGNEKVQCQNTNYQGVKMKRPADPIR
ncbi:hypothetical protein H6P81_006680 [Aristolochia fimbriata]|uniref:Transmembrane protein n=1 Tax=Aristolochia fimbriata TaxID=158543 RepID=A0AAV7F0Q9_ARIFI|nr:hypothetical protein H6P81_006680 [Aristolochia fimbriata]